MNILNLFVVAALSSFGNAELPFSVNDLSILLPLEKAPESTHKYEINPGHPVWKILSLDNFRAVLVAAESEGVFLTPQMREPRSWRLVGLRYVPCTLFAGSAPVCKEQLRFVFQSFGAERSTDGFDDYAIHVVYNFSELGAPGVSLRLESFRALKNRFGRLTLDRPLSVHPVLASEHGPEYFGALESEVIRTHVSSRWPSLITFAGLGEGGSQSDHWVFFTGNVDGRGKWSLAPLNVGGPLRSEHMQISSEDETLLVSNVRAGPGQIDLFDSKSGLDPSLPWKILDQRQTNDHNVACASCHVADARAFPVLFDRDDQLAKGKFLGRTMEMLNGKPRVTESLIDNSVHVGRIGFEAPAVRIFGYLDDRPLISQRVVEDGALAAEQANDLFNLKPTAQCQSDSQRKTLLACLYFGSPSVSLETCLKSACR